VDSKNKKLKKKIYRDKKEISKQIPRWPNKLINHLQQHEDENEGNVAEDHGIHS